MGKKKLFSHGDKAVGLSVRITKGYNDSDEPVADRFYRVIPIVDGTEFKSSGFAIKGKMPKLAEDFTYIVSGTFQERNGYLNMFVDKVEKDTNITADSFVKYVKNILKENGVKGIRGLKQGLEQIHEDYGSECFNVLVTDAHLYFKDKYADKIQDIIQKNMNLVKMSTYLNSYGFNASQVKDIMEYFSYDAKNIKNVIETNPYLLLQKGIKNIGFKTVDNVAMNKGLDPESELRLGFGMEYALKYAEEAGAHCYLTKRNLLSVMLDELGIKSRYIERYLNEKGIRMHIGEFLARLKTDETLRKDFGTYFAPVNKRLKEILDKKIEDGDIIEATVGRYNEDGEIKMNKGYYLPYTYKMERYVADRLISLSSVSTSVNESEVRKALKEEMEKDGKSLTEEQQTAVVKALTSRLSVITGSAGTGKTTTVRYALKMFKRILGHSDSEHSISETDMINTAPTGKAANRAKEVSGIDGMTIHRLLEYRRHEFIRNADNPIQQKVVIVDETSMADLSLFYHFLKAISDDTFVILVGDHYQLPSVGKGYVFGDIVDSDYPVTRLTKVWRQAEGSSLLNFCDDIRQGKVPNITNPLSEGFEWTGKHGVLGCTFEQLEEKGITPHQLLEDLVKDKIPNNYGTNDIQALAAKKNGDYGVRSINEYMQESLNPLKIESDRVIVKSNDTKYELRVGDRIIHVKNNSELMVFNGEVGTLIGINHDDKVPSYVTKISDNIVTYSYKDLFELNLAYSLTIHKSQGSEYGAVVMFVGSWDKFMVDRSLLYTASTRAKDFLFLVYSDEHIDGKGNLCPDMINYSSRHVKARFRNTNLRYLINLKIDKK